MRNIKLSFTILILFIIVLVLVSCWYPKEEAGQIQEETETTKETAINQNVVEISIKNSKFSPGIITIDKGATVTWINKDAYPHTVTSGKSGESTGIFDSGSIAGGTSFSYTFNNKGTFNYFCEFHEDMKGTIDVK